MSSPDARPLRLDPDALVALEEQRDFLLASLRDLEREHEAGDLDEGDLQTLRDDYTARAAEVLRAIESQRSAFAQARRPRRPARTALIAVGVALFAGAAGLAVAKTIGARDPNGTASGGIQVRQNPTQQAGACLSTGAFADPTGLVKALTCLDKVLAADSGNPTALTYKGWLLHLTSLVPGLPARVTESYRRQAVVYVERAVKADPRLPDARAFRTILAVDAGRYADAQRYLADLTAMHPPAEILQLIQQNDVPGRIQRGLAVSHASPGKPTTPPSTAGP